MLVELDWFIVNFGAVCLSRVCFRFDVSRLCFDLTIWSRNSVHCKLGILTQSCLSLRLAVPSVVYYIVILQSFNISFGWMSLMSTGLSLCVSDRNQMLHYPCAGYRDLRYIIGFVMPGPFWRETGQCVVSILSCKTEYCKTLQPRGFT